MPTANRLPALSAFVAGLSLACASAWAGEVRDVALHASATGTRAEIQLAGGGSYKTLSLSAPNRELLQQALDVVLLLDCDI